MDLEVVDCKGLDPSKIYIINVKRLEGTPIDAFSAQLSRLTSQLDNLGLKYTINFAECLEVEISEIIPNNKFVLNLTKD